MSGLLAYSYSACLSEKEQTKTDQQVKENRKKFCRGFETGTKIAIAVYSIYRVTEAAAAYAADNCSEPGPAPAAPQNLVVVKPTTARPGFKPIDGGTKGAFVGGASGVCAESGDFFLGLACAFLLIVGGIIINRPPAQNT